MALITIEIILVKETLSSDTGNLVSTYNYSVKSDGVEIHAGTRDGSRDDVLYYCSTL